MNDEELYNVANTICGREYEKRFKTKPDNDDLKNVVVFGMNLNVNMMKTVITIIFLLKKRTK